MDRNWLNERLLTEAEKKGNVEILFEHKLLRCDIAKGAMTFLYKGKEKVVTADLIVGADGVYSQVRTGLMRNVKFVLISFCANARMDFAQTYIDCMWCELVIPASDVPTQWEGYKMIPERLHIWPRGNFMLIALPNNVLPRDSCETDNRTNHSLAPCSCRNPCFHQSKHPKTFSISSNFTSLTQFL